MLASQACHLLAHTLVRAPWFAMTQGRQKKDSLSQPFQLSQPTITHLTMLVKRRNIHKNRLTGNTWRYGHDHCNRFIEYIAIFTERKGGAKYLATYAICFEANW